MTRIKTFLSSLLLATAAVAALCLGAMMAMAALVIGLVVALAARLAISAAPPRSDAEAIQAPAPAA